MIIEAKEGGELRLEPANDETFTIPTNWPLGDELVIEAKDRPVTVVINPHQVVKMRIGPQS